MKPYLRENGYYYVRRPDGKYKSLGTKDLREAKQMVAIQSRAVLEGRLGQLISSAKTPLSFLLKKFLEANKNRLSENSLKTYTLSMKLFIDAVGDLDVSAISNATIEKFTNACFARKAKRVSINTYLRHVKVMLHKADDLDINIVRVPKIRAMRIKKRHARILEKDEIDILLLHSQHCDPEIHRYIKFALWTGCRRSEIWNLTWGNVKDSFGSVIGKGDRERTLPFRPEAIKAIGVRPSTAKDDDYVFKHYVNVLTITKKFKKIARGCEIDDVHFHHLRHTAATYMLASDVDLPYVQEMLGHSDVKTTRIYAEILREKLRKQMQKFEL